MVYLKIKRLIDIVLSSLGLIILSPVFLLLIKVSHPCEKLTNQGKQFISSYLNP